MTATTAVTWTAARLGAPTEALEIRTVDVAEPGPNQVRIVVEAFCLDFNDVDTIRGRYGLLRFEPPFVAGMAAAGTVEAAGPGCEGLLGQRVVGTTTGRSSTVRPCNGCRPGWAPSTGWPCSSPSS